MNSSSSLAVKHLIKKHGVDEFVVVVVEVLGEVDFNQPEKEEFFHNADDFISVTVDNKRWWTLSPEGRQKYGQRKKNKNVLISEKAREQFYLTTIDKKFLVKEHPLRNRGPKFLLKEEKKLGGKLWSGSSHPRRGKKHSPETIAHMSEMKKGEKNPMYNKPKSEYFLQKRSRPGGLHHRAKAIVLQNFSTGAIEKFPTLTERGAFLGFGNGAMVSKHLKNNLPISFKGSKQLVWKVWEASDYDSFKFYCLVDLFA